MTDDKSIGGIVVAWYESSVGGDDGAARAARARLRRCESPADALTIDATHELDEHLGKIGERRADRLALLATTFARLRGVRGRTLAALFGEKPGGDGPRLLSELRFQSLIRARSHRELIVPLRRSLAVLGSEPACDGYALAEDLYWWGEEVRNRWCFQYFGAGFAAENQGETVR